MCVTVRAAARPPFRSERERERERERSPGVEFNVKK